MKPRRNPNGCFVCGRECTKSCVDSHGQPYMGCPVCVVVLPGHQPEPCKRCKGSGIEAPTNVETGAER